MTRILRYEVPIDDQWHEISGCSLPLHVGCRTADVVEFWAYESEPPHRHVREFRVFGTGQPFDGDHWYAGTAASPGGQFIWHLVERTP